MDTTGRLDLWVWRNDDVYEFPLTVVGPDLTGVELKLEARLIGDTPGSAPIALGTVTNGNAEGLRLAGVTFDALGRAVNDVRLRLNKSTRQDVNKLPYMGELGDTASLRYALLIAGKTRLIGHIYAPAHAYGSDAAPLSRPIGFVNPASCGSPSDGATLTISDKGGATLTIGGLSTLDEVAVRLLAKRQDERALMDARSILYGISDDAAARLFTALSSEAAFDDGFFRSGYDDGDTPAVLPEWGYARGGAATAPTASGVLVPFAAGQPRVTDAGLRIEPASRNGARRSNDFTSPLWTKEGVTVAAEPGGPLGTVTRVTPVSAGYHYVGQAMEQVGTRGIYAKADGIRRLDAQIDLPGGKKRAVFDMVTGAVIQADAGVSAYVYPGPLGYNRYVATVATAATATVRFHALTDDNADTFQADGTKSFLIAGAQVEPGAVPTSYIDTLDLPATRYLDAASLAFAPAGDFTLFAEVDLPRPLGNENAIFSLIGNSPNDRIMLLRDGAGRFAVEVANNGVAARQTGPALAAGVVRCAVSVSGSQVLAALQDGTVITLNATRPAVLRTLWLGIRGTPDLPLNGALRSILTLPRALLKEDLIAMTALPRPLSSSEALATMEAMRQMIVAHGNDQTVHGIPDMLAALTIANSKEGIWSPAASDTFTGTDGTPLGTTETGGYTWANPGNFQRIGGRAKQPAGAFGGAAIDTAFSDGQIEADLYPANGGEASLVFRSNTNFNQYMLLQRGGDGTIRLAYVFTSTELLSPLISMPVVAGERWKVRFFGSSILTYRTVNGETTLIHNVTDKRLTTNRRHGLRLNGASTIDNFRLLQRETL